MEIMKPIRVYDQQLNMLTETDNYLSLQFNPRFYEVGDFELHINQYVEGAEYFVKGNLIVLDKREDKAMLIRHREIALDQNGKVTENWRVTGVTLKGVLDQRVTIPPEHTSHDRITDNAETVMKHYVDRHFVNPVDADRKIDYIEITPDQGRGQRIEWESRFKNVADELTAISKQANLGWVMYADIERGKWIFDVVEPRDVTQGNEAGLQPVFFSPDFSTIKTQQFVDSDLNYKNVGFVGGQGEGVERKIVKVGEAEGIDLHEVFIDARDVSETDEETEEELSDEEYEQLLIERGERRMREFETTFYLEAQILTPSINRSNDFAMSTPFEYETDFRLGDLVQVFNKKWNITMDAPITEFTEIHDPGGFILEAIFGEAQPTLITKIRDKFNELEGIEKQELPARLAVERMRDAMQYGDERLSEEERARIEHGEGILEESKRYTDEQRETYVGILDDLQEQVDGQIQSHFYRHAPSMDNEPAVNWVDYRERRRHEGDLFFDRSTGYAYRFTIDYIHLGFLQAAQPVTDIIYGWERIQDSDIIEALRDASHAQDTANSKRRTFVVTPYPPYDEGDLWVQEVGEIMKIYKADISRAEDEDYNSDDWTLAGDITNENFSLDTDNVAGEPAPDVKDKANSGKDAKDKIDEDVGAGIIEDTGGSQQKADDAEGSAKDHADNAAGSAEDNAKGYADQQDEVVEENAKQDATEKADAAEGNAKEYTDGQVVYVLDEIDERLKLVIDEDDVRFIFEQEAGSLTFDADQINFDGHVFGEDATFGGVFESVGTDNNFLRIEDAHLLVERHDPDIDFISKMELEYDEGMALRMSDEGLGPYYQNDLILSPHNVSVSRGQAGNVEFARLDAEELSSNRSFTFKSTTGIFYVDSVLGQGQLDYIIDEGSNADGDYVRYASGLQVCWHKMNLGSMVANGNGTWSSPYRTPAAANEWFYPMPFSSPPAIFAQLAVDDNNWNRRAGTVNFDTASSTSVQRVQAYRLSDNGTDNEGVCSIMAIGRW